MVKIKKFRFLENGLAGDVYYERGRNNFDGLGVFLFGFPAFPGQNPVIEIMAKSGLLVVQPHYFGSYDSSGTFSPSGLSETLQAVAVLTSRGFIRQSKDESAFPTPTKWSVCIGHSFGCAAALRGFRHLPDLHSLLLLAPTAHYGRHPIDYGVREDGPGQLEYVRTSHPHTYRLASAEEWQEVLTGADALPAAEARGAVERATVVFGSEDSYFDTEIAQRNMPYLLNAYCNSTTEPTVIVAPGRGHPAPELVDCEPAFNLQKYLSIG